LASIQKRDEGGYRARYRDPAGREHAKHFRRKVDAQQWLDQQAASVLAGTWVTPKTQKTTVAQWCEIWLAGYATRRASTVRQAEVHIAQIKSHFGPMQLAAVRPSHVKSWTAKLAAEGLADSYVYALHRRLAQIMDDAVHDGILARSPCSRRTSPPAGKQTPYVATTQQVWALHDAMPEQLRAAVLVGAFAGLRLAEACGLRVSDVVYMRGIVTPAVQFPAEPLKTDYSRTPVPIPRSLALRLSAQVQRWPGETVLTGRDGKQLSTWALERAMRTARKKVPGLPEGFRYHDLRHYLASLLIASGADVKVVQNRLRHGSASTTLDIYAHLWPDQDESTRAAIERVMAAKFGAASDPASQVP
jgi:integrase